MTFKKIEMKTYQPLHFDMFFFRTGMLNKGVERIVEQIVNPKIMQLIKPKTDEVTCDVLGISLTEHQNALKKKQLEQQEKLLKSPDTPGIQSIMSMNFTSPPPGVIPLSVPF